MHSLVYTILLFWHRDLKKTLHNVLNLFVVYVMPFLGHQNRNKFVVTWKRSIYLCFFDSYLNNWPPFVIYCWYLNAVYALLDMILVIEWNLVIRTPFLFINILLQFFRQNLNNRDKEIVAVIFIIWNLMYISLINFYFLF